MNFLKYFKVFYFFFLALVQSPLVHSKGATPPSVNSKDEEIIEINICDTKYSREYLEKVDFARKLISMNPPLNEECQIKSKNILRDKNIFGAQFKNIDLTHVGIQEASNLRGVNFSGGYNPPKDLLRGKEIFGCKLEGLDLTHVGLEGALDTIYLDFTGSRNAPFNMLAGKEITNSKLSGLDLTHVGLKLARGLYRVDFSGSFNASENMLVNKDIVGAKLAGLDLTLVGAQRVRDFNDVDFSGSTNAPINMLAGKHIQSAKLNGLNLTHVGINQVTNFDLVDFSGSTHFPENFFVGKSINYAKFSGHDLKMIGIEQATILKGIIFESSFYFSRPLIFSDYQITTLEHESPWQFRNNAKGIYAGIEFNREEFITILKVANLIKVENTSSEMKSYLADLYFKKILQEPQMNPQKFKARLQKILIPPTQLIDPLTFLTDDQSELIDLLKKSYCQDLIPSDLKIDPRSPADQYLRNKFNFSSSRDFLLSLAYLCFTKCQDIRKSRENIAKNRLLLKMPASAEIQFKINHSPDKISADIDLFLQNTLKQSHKSLHRTTIHYVGDGQMGIDAGGLKRDFYDSLMEHFKDPEKNKKLKYFNQETLGRIVAMQVGVEEGIAGFDMDLDESYYQNILNHANQSNTKVMESKINILKNINNLICSEDPSERQQVKYFLLTLIHPENSGEEIFEENKAKLENSQLEIKNIITAFDRYLNELIPNLGIKIEDLSENICHSVSAQSLQPGNPLKTVAKQPECASHPEFIKGFFQIMSREKILKLMPLDASELKRIIEGDPTPDAKAFFEKHFLPQGFSGEQTKKFESVLQKYFNQNGSDIVNQKIQVAKLLKFATGSTQIKSDKKVTFNIFRKNGFFVGHTCHHSVDCFEDVLNQSEEEILTKLQKSIDEGLASGMQLR
jgi:uncharacterized protein YjbI with pentapeptide repeats